MIPLTHYQHLDDQQQFISSFQELLSNLKEDTQAVDDETSTAVEHLIKILDIHQTDAKGLDEDELTEIGDLGMHLLDSLHAESQTTAERQSLFNYIALAFSFWVARNKGTLKQIDLPVNALAQAANSLYDKVSLEALFEAAAFILLQTDENIKTSADRFTKDTPWHTLNMNFGIVATRTHTPELMESAYKTLIFNYPDSAPGFFKQAMSEMVRLDYPQHVRTVVERYHEKYPLLD